MEDEGLERDSPETICTYMALGKSPCPRAAAQRFKAQELCLRGTKGRGRGFVGSPPLLHLKQLGFFSVLL